MVCGVEWCGVVCGVVCGVAWRVVLLAWSGVQLGLWLGVFCDVVWYGVVWGAVWCGVVCVAWGRPITDDFGLTCRHGVCTDFRRRSAPNTPKSGF